MIPGHDFSKANRVFTRAELDGRGVRFVFAKASGGVHADPKFAAHMLTARWLGRGAYGWVSEGDPIDSQIEAFFAAVAPVEGQGRLVPAVDCEPFKGVAFKQPRRMAAMIRCFLEELIEPLLYASPAVLAQFTSAERRGLASISRLWIAHYGVQAPHVPSEWERWTVWQRGTVPVTPGHTLPAIDDDVIADEATFAALFGGAS